MVMSSAYVMSWRGGGGVGISEVKKLNRSGESTAP